MTSDARGTAATPFEVSINVNIIVICWPNDMCHPIVVSAAWATNTDAIARYKVEPVEIERIAGWHHEPDDVRGHAETFHRFHRFRQRRLAACRRKCERGRLAHRTHELVVTASARSESPVQKREL